MTVLDEIAEERRIGRSQGVNHVLAWLQRKGHYWLTVEYLREAEEARRTDNRAAKETPDAG